MTEPIHPQCRIVPIRMLHPENAAKFLDGLSCIPGIRRVLIHGPGFCADQPGSTQESCKIQPHEYAEVMVGQHQVDLHVLVGDVIVEAVDDDVITKIAQFCSEFFVTFPYQILVGQFLKTKPSLADYVKSGSNPDEILVGMSDYNNRIETVYIPVDLSEP